MYYYIDVIILKDLTIKNEFEYLKNKIKWTCIKKYKISKIHRNFVVLQINA